MSAEFAHELQQERAAAHALRARIVLGIGWVVMLAGVVWALAQPYRLTILHPYGQGFWWLVSEPPLYVVLAGVVFRLVVAKPLVEDLEPAGPPGRAGQRDPAFSSSSRTRPAHPVDR